MKIDQHPLNGWIPYKLRIENDAVFVQWLYVGTESFGDPFFDETVARCQSHPYNSSPYRCLSSLESMTEWANPLLPVNPAAFIFHVSRCGSTLLSQLIGTDQKYVTLAEVPFFDDILRLPYKKSDNANVQSIKKYLTAAIKFIAVKRSVEQEQVFIKTDSWHILFYELFRELFPSTPFIFLYRSPDEVIRSHQKFRGMQAVPGIIEPQVFGFDKSEIEAVGLDDYTANVLAKYFSAFAEALDKDKRILLLNYKQGAMPMIEETGKYLGISWTEEHLLQMHERGRYHSKHPDQPFSEEMKKTEIPEYQQKAMLLYEALEAKRTGL